MGAHSPYPGPQDLLHFEAQYLGLAPPLTGGRVFFDFLFGLVAPVLLLVADPGVFTHAVASRAAFPAYLAAPAYILVGGLCLALVAWLLAAARRPALGLLLVGPFTAGTLVWLLVALKLTGFALGYADTLVGLLALTPWFTAVVLGRHAFRALRVGARASVLGAGFSLVVATIAIFVALALVAKVRYERAALLEDLYFSRDAAEHDQAVQWIAGTQAVDFDAIVDRYAALSENDPRHARLADSFLRIANEPMDEALRRLGHLPDEPPPRVDLPEPGRDSPGDDPSELDRAFPPEDERDLP